MDKETLEQAIAYRRSGMEAEAAIFQAAQARWEEHRKELRTLLAIRTMQNAKARIRKTLEET